MLLCDGEASDVSAVERSRSTRFADVSPERRRIMQAVRSKDTGPEMIVRRLAHRLGYRFRLHRKDLPGNPDLVFPARRKVVFVHGCFWHRHECRRGSRAPKTNREYWRRKLDRNRIRDGEVSDELERSGWKVKVFWECELRDIGQTAERLCRFLE